MMQDPVAVAVFHSFELNVNQAEGFFELCDDGDGRLTFDEFVTGMLRLKGGARNIDLVTMLYENKKLTDKMYGLDQAIRTVMEMLSIESAKLSMVSEAVSRNTEKSKYVPH